MKGMFNGSLLVVFGFSCSMVFAQERGIKINLDSLTNALEGMDIRTINDHVGKDFRIRQQESRIEIFENGIKKHSFPATLHRYIDFQKFDSVRVDLVGVKGLEDRSIVVRCYGVEQGNKNSIMDILKLNSSPVKKQ